ncbi:serine O-acetyltransferase [Kinneretia aquatilis]|nr:serine acetyltransferase [Paucibacter aquatile]
MLEADRLSRGEKRTRPRLIGDDIWKYQIILRHYEYWLKKRGFFATLARSYWHYRYYKQSIRLNFEIPPFVFAAGLSIAHRGPIIINPNSRIGENCRIHSGVNIGTAAGTQNSAPTLGDNCYIGPGAKLFGAIRIADGVAIAAQAVVNKSCETEGVTLGGVPARVIAMRSAKDYIIPGATIYDKSAASTGRQASC